MSEIKMVGIKNLKKNFSSYLQDVKKGTRIFITDHQELVAELREPDITGEQKDALKKSRDYDADLLLNLSEEIKSALLQELGKY